MLRPHKEPAVMTDARWAAERRNDESFGLLISTLQDPMSPDGYCAHELSFVISAWALHGPITASNRLVLLRSVAKFLTVPRSQQERMAIKTRLLACGCGDEKDPDDQSIATLGEAHLSYYFEKALVHMGDVMYTALNSLSTGKFRTGKFRKEKEKRRREAQPWPLSVDDLFPAGEGPEGALRALMGWAELGPGGYGPFIAIAGFTTFWEPFGREVFRNPTIFASAARKLKLGCKAYTISQNSFDPFFVWSVFACAERFLHSLRCFPPVEAMTALMPVYNELFFVSKRIVPILGDRFPNAHYWFQTLIDFQPTHALAASNPNVVIRFQSEQGHEGVFASLVTVRNDNRCMNIQCTAPLGTKTTTCAGCAVIRYCGKPCQRTAWKATVSPHRTLCKHIGTFLEKLELSSGATEWNDWLAGKPSIIKCQNFDELCRRKGVDPALSDSICAEIKALEAASKGVGLAHDRFRW
ncbi:hypothetical protein C8R43DRAFT_1005466 [Mycena crocata]|nr:hypothetical protein C8R43DRAFT_1005466 [Mycena crocata]